MTGMARLLIGDIAEHTGIAPPTIRYYESIGLLATPSRTEGGYRRYTTDTVDQLHFIRKAQALGFSLDEIGEILKLSRAGKTPCSHVLSLAHQHLAAVDDRIQQLQRFRAQLASELEKWNGTTAPTCEGLCQIIASSGADVQPVEFPSHRAARPARSTKR
ncbi:MAG: heavy metal-responsive transcriptional regulator [Tepidisphaeraceae bacterium]